MIQPESRSMRCAYIQKNLDQQPQIKKNENFCSLYEKLPFGTLLVKNPEFHQCRINGHSVKLLNHTKVSLAFEYSQYSQHSHGLLTSCYFLSAKGEDNAYSSKNEIDVVTDATELIAYQVIGLPNILFLKQKIKNIFTQIVLENAWSNQPFNQAKWVKSLSPNLTKSPINPSLTLVNHTAYSFEHVHQRQHKDQYMEYFFIFNGYTLRKREKTITKIKIFSAKNKKNVFFMSPNGPNLDGGIHCLEWSRFDANPDALQKVYKLMMEHFEARLALASNIFALSGIVKEVAEKMISTLVALELRSFKELPMNIRMAM